MACELLLSDFLWSIDIRLTIRYESVCMLYLRCELTDIVKDPVLVKVIIGSHRWVQD